MTTNVTPIQTLLPFIDIERPRRRRISMREKLEANLITLHNLQGSLTIVFNAAITQRAREMGLTKAKWNDNVRPATIAITNTEGKRGKFDGEYLTNYSYSKVNALINSKTIVEGICRMLGIGEGVYRLVIEEIPNDYGWIVLAVKEVRDVTCGRKTAPPATATALTAFTDEQLYTELRRRGYEGTLHKTCTLE